MNALSLETLLDGEAVEQHRVVYRKEWDPDFVMRNVCAFANDYNDMNGGFIVIGVDCEEGTPVLPPAGLPMEELDRIREELREYCSRIRPGYVPEAEVVDCKGTGAYLLYLRCPAGTDGPYQSPYTVVEGRKDGSGDGIGTVGEDRLCYWIRPASVAVPAGNEEIAGLYARHSTVRYEDLVNRRATVDDIDERIVQKFLDARSNPAAIDMAATGLEKTLLSLHAAEETDSGLAIRNIGVLMFTERPEKFIPEAKIELVRFRSPEEEGAYSLYEHTYNGPVWEQVNEIMGYIEATVIERKTVNTAVKTGQVYCNYPIDAIREIIVNAVIHKSYRQADPVQVRIYEDHITVFNYPGLSRDIMPGDFVNGLAVSRQCRNRRIGGMFREIHLTGEPGSGIGKVLRELENNGSPAPVFDMDGNRTYLEATICIRAGFRNGEHIKGGESR